jgi:NAD(P)-dependent dehydrogenase (short-subunit alcohol dehydrogenase family)
LTPTNDAAVLINNAAIGGRTTEATEREYWNNVLNVNVTSLAVTSSAFLPLLGKSDDPRIINISSARGSFTRVASGANPPIRSATYSVSKSAENMLTLGMAELNPDITFQAYNPGHCKTAFNGFRGTRDPLEGAQGAAGLALAEKGRFEAGFWEWEGGKLMALGW